MMNTTMHIFLRQKGRQRGNNMLPIVHGGTGARVARRRVDRAMKKRRPGTWDELMTAYCIQQEEAV